jgi:hypothetical protein
MGDGPGAAKLRSKSGQTGIETWVRASDIAVSSVTEAWQEADRATLAMLDLRSATLTHSRHAMLSPGLSFPQKKNPADLWICGVRCKALAMTYSCMA